MSDKDDAKDVKDAKDGKILNPESQRYIKIGGPTYIKLLKKGLIMTSSDKIFNSIPVLIFVPDKKSIVRTVKSVMKSEGEGEGEKEKVVSLKSTVDIVLRKVNEKLDKTESNLEGWTIYSIRDYISSLIMSDCAVPDKLEIENEILDYKRANKTKVLSTKHHIETIYKSIKKKYKVFGYTKNEHFDALYDTIKDRYNITVI